MNASATPQKSAYAPDEKKVSAAENLRFAIADHQEIIRGSDLKAEVLGIFLTATSATIAWEGSISSLTMGGWLGIAATIATLVAFYCVGGVLWPRSDPWRDLPLGDYMPSRILYPQCDSEPGYTVREHATRALVTEWPSELAYELLKLSRIRCAKQKWFRLALIASAASVFAISVRLFVR